MDPWSALQVAASILQFVDFGYKICSGAKEVYESADGAKKETAELKLLLKDIQTQNDRYAHSKTLTDDEQDLQALATKSLELSQSLEKILKKLTVRDGIRFRVLESARVSVETIRKSKEIADLKQRLLNLQGHLQQRLARILQAEQASGLSYAIRSLQNRNNRRFCQVLAVLEQQAQNQQRQHQDQHQFLSDLSSGLLTTIKEAKRATLNQEIISSLWFKTLKYREDSVEKAYDDTVGWLFDPNETPFCQWLESGKGLFWISGLAGSGKSTLMKFASHNPKTKTILFKWANGRELHVANFFFWNSGFDMQKSQRGLLQSLLVQIFQFQPDLVTSLCPDRNPKEPWGIEELKAVFNKLQDESLSNLAFCFFIDGLDEYDGEENEIIDVLQSLSRVPHIKICTSSRPWTAFEKAFGDSQQALRVQEHTMEDMKVYVRGTLEEHIDFQRLAVDDPRCLSLVPELADRANGVWLWVYLVVKDLTRDIEGRENYDFLKKRLDAVPSKLEEYFEKIMSRIDDIYKEETAQIFLLMIESATPPLLLAVEFLGLERQCPNFALGETFSCLSRVEAAKVCEDWVPRIRNRCRDLLNVQLDRFDHYLSQWRVGFLHRTVGDWLRKNHQDALRKNASKTFDPTIATCRITFALIRLAIEWILRDGPNRGWDLTGPWGTFVNSLILEFAILAFKLEQTGKEQIAFKYIEALDPTVSRLASLKLVQRSVWSPFIDDATKEDLHPTFLATTVHLGLSKYAQYALLKNPEMLHKRGRPMLSYSIWPRGSFTDKSNMHTRAADMDLVKLLLHHGADPNDMVPYLNESVLSEFAKCSAQIYENRSQSGQESIFTIAKLLIEHGGNWNRTFGSHSARHFFGEIFTPHQMDELNAIVSISKPQVVAAVAVEGAKAVSGSLVAAVAATQRWWSGSTAGVWLLSPRSKSRY